MKSEISDEIINYSYQNPDERKLTSHPTAKFHLFKVNYIAVRYKRIHSHYINGYIVHKTRKTLKHTKFLTCS